MASAEVRQAHNRPGRLHCSRSRPGSLWLPPVAAALDALRPPLMVLLPQVALGLLGLALPDRSSRAIRLAPALSALSAVVATEFLVDLDPVFIYYGAAMEVFLPTVGGLLLVVGALLAMGLALGGDARGGWALVTLLTPAGFLAVPGLADNFGPAGGGITVAELAVTAVAVALAGPAVLLLAVVLRSRRTSTPQPSGQPCPTCGARALTTRR
ncbi:hypothetical protein ABGB10_03645 [Micromonospora sp. B9E7]